MEIYNLTDDVKVFGFRVTDFPNGIDEAFQSLIHKVPDGFERSYYGISFMDKDGQMIYNAAALEKYEGEAEKYNCERYIIEKGEYLAVSLYAWRKKTAAIKDVFHKIMEDNRVNKTKPAIEWYKNNDEMMCMVQTNRQKNEIAG